MHQPIHGVHKSELSEAFRSLVLGRTVYLTCFYGLCCPLRLMIPISLSTTHIQDMKKPLECARSASFRCSHFESLPTMNSRCSSYPTSLEHRVIARTSFKK